MSSVRLEQQFSCIFKIAVLVPPHSCGWQENCIDRQLHGALVSRGEDKEECRVISWMPLLKTHLPYLVNLLSHFEAKIIGFMTSHKLTLWTKGRENSYNARVRRFASCTHACVCMSFSNARHPVSSVRLALGGARPWRGCCWLHSHYSPRL